VDGAILAALAMSFSEQGTHLCRAAINILADAMELGLFPSKRGATFLAICSAVVITNAGRPRWLQNRMTSSWGGVGRALVVPRCFVRTPYIFLISCSRVPVSRASSRNVLATPNSLQAL